MTAPLTVLTGATGFLGGEILQRLLAVTQDDVVAVVHPRSAHRLAAFQRLQVVPADLTESGGISPSLMERVAGRSVRIIHAAASVRFDATLQEARRINVGATQRVIDFAVAASAVADVRRVAHISTAFVSGTRVGRVPEDHIDESGPFRNTYEQSKAEAESLVRRHIPLLPITILRPAIVTGSSGGSTVDWAIRIFRRGLVSHIPGSPDSLCDLVPAAAVASAIVSISGGSHPSGSCFHLASGRPVTLGAAVALARDVFGVTRRTRFVDPDRYRRWIRPVMLATLWGPRRRIVRTDSLVLPYLAMYPDFDVSATEAILGPGWVPDSFSQLDTLLRSMPGPVA